MGNKSMVYRRIILWILCCIGGWGVASRAEDVSDVETKTPKKTKADTIADARIKDRSQDPAVNAWYDQLLGAYMKANWPEFVDLYKQFPKMRLQLAPNQRSDALYMRNTAEEFRPGWWKHTQSTKNKSFQAEIWGRRFIANYVPSETIGATRSLLDMGRKKVQVIVSWRPTYVDNPKPYSNDNSFHVFIPEAKNYDFTFGTMGEVIVWHELGHNYITLNLPMKHLYTLYREYVYLFSHLQEFYADLTALYHASPPGRLFAMKLRLMNMVDYDETDVHTRGCAHAVGALLLAKILSEPDKWPSFHFPGKVPEKDIEQMTIFYLYRHVDSGWTLAEDRRLREFINKWVRSKGASALRKRGKILLPNGQAMNILAGEDRQLQRKRDQWIQRKLEAIIENGRADDPKIFENDMRDIENRVRFVPVKKLRNRDESDSGRDSSRRRTNNKRTKDKPTRKKQDDDLDDVLGEEDD
jgi:hypothetical protein